MAEPQPKKHDWEQTLVAETVPEPAPEPELSAIPEIPPPETPAGAPEPVPLEEVPPLEMPPEEEPAPEGEALPVDVPPELRKFVKWDGTNLVLRQPYLDSETKATLEKRAARKKGAKLVERRWHPYRRDSVRTIEAAVDDLKWQSRYEPKAVAWLGQAAERHKAFRGLQRIPGNVIESKVVYKTDRGFVVEVTHKELGEVVKTYFAVPGRKLSSFKRGEFAATTLVSDELVDYVTRGRSRKT